MVYPPPPYHIWLVMVHNNLVQMVKIGEKSAMKNMEVCTSESSMVMDESFQQTLLPKLNVDIVQKPNVS